jgi:hypothetical protein
MCNLYLKSRTAVNLYQQYSSQLQNALMPLMKDISDNGGFSLVMSFCAQHATGDNPQSDMMSKPRRLSSNYFFSCNKSLKMYIRQAVNKHVQDSISTTIIFFLQRRNYQLLLTFRYENFKYLFFI